jgi:hypothetical protein
MTDDRERSTTDGRRSSLEPITRRVFLGSSAITAGALAVPGVSSADDSSGGAGSTGGLTTEDIMDLSLELVGAEEVPPDSGIYVQGEEIETALVGIDIESPELQLANSGGYDVAIAHHPTGGYPILDFDGIFDRGVELMVEQGVPRERAREAVADKRDAWALSGVASNYRHTPSVAELLDVPYLNIHRPIDELSRRAFAEVIGDLPADATVSDLNDAFHDALPEVRAAKNDITTALGEDDNELGDVALYHAAGTNGGASVARAFYDNGYDTVMYIHVDAGDISALEEEYDDRNLLVTGHVVGDGVGFRMFIEALQAHGVDVTPISGADIANVAVPDGDVTGDSA